MLFGWSCSCRDPGLLKVIFANCSLIQRACWNVWKRLGDGNSQSFDPSLGCFERFTVLLVCLTWARVLDAWPLSEWPVTLLTSRAEISTNTHTYTLSYTRKLTQSLQNHKVILQKNRCTVNRLHGTIINKSDDATEGKV